MDHLYVVGNPISHSLSPSIHHEFARECGIKLRYEPLCLSLDHFEAEMNTLLEKGMVGASVTVPFKERAFQFASQTTERAKKARAVNALKRIGDRQCLGDNTDGVGLIRDMTDRLKWPLQDQSILIIGAGGAARGILAPLLAMQPRMITILNRTREKASLLCSEFKDINKKLILQAANTVDTTFDIVINATSSSLQNTVPESILNLSVKDSHCYDLFYAKQLTPFCAFAAEKNALSFSDGLGMLVEQAREAFFLWYGIRPSTSDLIQQIRKMP